MKAPFFTICIPTFNRAHMVGKAIDSVVRQTFTDWQLIILDNHSTDGTEELLREKCRGFGDKIRVIRHATNIGGTANFNFALQSAEGQWMGILPDDDEYRLHALETIHAAVSQRDDLVLWTHAQIALKEASAPHAVLFNPYVLEYETSKMAELLYQRGNVFGQLSCYFLNVPALRASKTLFAKGTTTIDLQFYIRFLRMNPSRRSIYWPDPLTCAYTGEESASFHHSTTGIGALDLLRHFKDLAPLGWRKRVLLYQLARLMKCAVKYRKVAQTSEGRAALSGSTRALLSEFFHRPAQIEPQAGSSRSDSSLSSER